MNPFRYFEHVDLEHVTKPQPYFVQPAGAKNTFVLVVDDEHLIADTLVAIFKAKGFSAFAAYDGDQGLRAARVLRPNVIVTDIAMPGMNGLEMAKAIREFLPETKVFLISGQASVLSLVDYGPIPKDFVLIQKPVHPDRLLHTLGEHLQRAS
jgi:DNA-binding NtrC family response regulator